MHAHSQTDLRLPLSPVHTSSQPPDEPNPDLLAPECSRDYDPLQVDAVAYLGYGQTSKGPSPLLAEWIQTKLRYRNDSIPSLKAAVRSLLQTAKDMRMLTAVHQRLCTVTWRGEGDLRDPKTRSLLLLP